MCRQHPAMWFAHEVDISSCVSLVGGQGNGFASLPLLKHPTTHFEHLCALSQLKTCMKVYGKYNSLATAQCIIDNRQHVVQRRNSSSLLTSDDSVIDADKCSIRVDTDKQHTLADGMQIALIPHEKHAWAIHPGTPCIHSATAH